MYAGDPHHFNASGLAGAGNPGQWMLYRYVYESVRIGQLFAAVFGPGSVGYGRRVRPVFAWQEGGGQAHEEGFAYLTSQLGLLPAQAFHAIAIAPYITMGAAANDPGLTADGVLAGWASWAANISIAGPYGAGGPNFVAPFAATGAFWGLECRAYEAGPDTVEGIDEGAPLWAKANASLDARIEPILVPYLRDWASLGPHMGAMNWYNAGAGSVDSPYGIYPVLYDMAVQATPKLAAIDAAIAGGPAPTSPLIPCIDPAAGCGSGGGAGGSVTLNASFFAGHPFPASPNGFFGWPSILNYPVQTNRSLSVTLVVTTATEYPGNVTLGVSMGGAAPTVFAVNCPPSGDWARYTPCAAAGPFAVPPGVTVFRVVRPPAHAPWVGELVFTVEGAGGRRVAL